MAMTPAMTPMELELSLLPSKMTTVNPMTMVTMAKTPGTGVPMAMTRRTTGTGTTTARTPMATTTVRTPMATTTARTPMATTVMTMRTTGTPTGNGPPITTTSMTMRTTRTLMATTVTTAMTMRTTPGTGLPFKTMALTKMVTTAMTMRTTGTGTGTPMMRTGTGTPMMRTWTRTRTTGTCPLTATLLALMTHGKNSALKSQLFAPKSRKPTKTRWTNLKTGTLTLTMRTTRTWTLKMRTTKMRRKRTTKMRRKRTMMPPLPMPRNELYVQTEALDSTSVYKRSLTRSFDYHYNWPLGQLIF